MSHTKNEIIGLKFISVMCIQNTIENSNFHKMPSSLWTQKKKPRIYTHKDEQNAEGNTNYIIKPPFV